MKFGKNIQKTLEQSLYVSVFMQICFFIKSTFSSFRPNAENNNAHFDAVSWKRGNFDAIQRSHNFDKKNLYECKGYNARQFITEFPDKGWTKNSINNEVKKVPNSRHVNKAE